MATGGYCGTCYAVFLPLERTGGVNHGSDRQAAEDLAQGRVLNIDGDALRVLESEYLSEPSSAAAVAPTYEKVNVWHFAQRCTNALAEKAVTAYDQHPVQGDHPKIADGRRSASGNGPVAGFDHPKRTDQCGCFSAPSSSYW